MGQMGIVEEEEVTQIEQVDQHLRHQFQESQWDIGEIKQLRIKNSWNAKRKRTCPTPRKETKDSILN
jgi:hypothetical protein